MPTQGGAYVLAKLLQGSRVIVVCSRSSARVQQKVVQAQQVEVDWVCASIAVALQSAAKRVSHFCALLPQGCADATR